MLKHEGVVSLTWYLNCVQVRDEIEAAEEYLIHRKAYAVLIKEAFEQQMFERSRFCKDVLRVITVIAYVKVLVLYLAPWCLFCFLLFAFCFFFFSSFWIWSVWSEAR